MLYLLVLVVGYFIGKYSDIIVDAVRDQFKR